jgi:hypothetical protein
MADLDPDQTILGLLVERVGSAGGVDVGAENREGL